MRYLSKFEQCETIGDVDDHDSDMLGTRSREGKGFSSFATADCPHQLAQAAGLPNEVDFAMNVSTIMSQPGMHEMQLSLSPQLITAMVAHCGVFNEGFGRMPAYLLTATKRSLLDAVERQLFVGVDSDYNMRDPVCWWRVFQVLSIFRNLPFETSSHASFAQNSALVKFLLLCANSRWIPLRNGALDILSNVAPDVGLTVQVLYNHPLLKTVARCRTSKGKYQIIRALEILGGVCTHERNESVVCGQRQSAGEDLRRARHQGHLMSELGQAACEKISLAWLHR